MTKTSKTSPKPASPVVAPDPALDAAVKKVASSTRSTAVDAPAATTPTQVSGVTRSIVANGVNKKELVRRVAKRAELRPNQVRAVTEAVLEELGLALSNSEELKLPGLGKMQVKRSKDVGKADVLICKLRRKKDENSDIDPLAPAAE
ncbi:HU family DNA-binding protein [Aliiroseovarius crassostreae]|uniref:HU family DNA-binding protein n=1 Tax=Aliiroseovarius crassostreae TaxID=154981 RepID=UPI002202B9A6|nr:HU family DNA-binding protein [Aliiroseovarius crassostreae]UWP99460.1 HU family DNA-binding protein [Aliiroseovarius crassostreae]